MPDRRTFLITCSGVVVTPALAQFALPPAEVVPSLGDSPGPSTLTLKIDGWEPHTADGSDVWIQVNSSWRATWR